MAGEFPSMPISDSQASVSCWLETYISRYLDISIGYLRKKKEREKQRGEENSKRGPDASSFLHYNLRGNIIMSTIFCSFEMSLSVQPTLTWRGIVLSLLKAECQIIYGQVVKLLHRL